MSAVSAKTNEMVGPLGSTDKNKQWQRELLMERLRTHSGQNKSFPELSKAMRMAMLEKRYSLDPTERGNLQKCLDSMQHCIKVTTRQGLIERLESLSRQLGLKFMEDTSGLFISSDMFYLEIVLDASGTLSDVKVHHECKIEQQSCSELVTCLVKGDFADFTTQLEGLSSIYQLNAEPKVKSKAFVALQAMEMDLFNLYAAQNFHKEAHISLLESCVGIVQKRRGGHPMKLTYFVSPYDLLNLESKSMMALSIDLLATQNIGMSVTVNLEASNPNNLQIQPTVTLNADAQGVNAPVFSPITPANSTVLPATFVLRLNKPIPVCDNLIEAIVETTQQNFGDPSGYSSIMELVVQTASGGALRTSKKGMFVTLPDQSHCYFLTENKRLRGSAISSIPYTEPSHVPKILSLLRQQVLFYTLLASCVRYESKMGDLENTTMLEVSAINIQQISIVLEHPFEESMATVEFHLKNASDIDCHIYSLANNYDAIAVKLTKIIQATLSIPITIRALLKFWEQEQMKGFQRGGIGGGGGAGNGIDNGNFSLPLGPNDPGGRMNDFRDIKPKMERNMNGNFGGGGSGGVGGGAGGNRPFFQASAVMMGGPTEAFVENNVHMFDGSSSDDGGGGMMNQFAMKATTGHEFMETQDCPVGEDFYKNPKSKTDMTMNQILSETSDSSSLGTSTPTSDLGVASNLNIHLRKISSHLDSDSNSPYVDGESSRNSLLETLTGESMTTTTVSAASTAAATTTQKTSPILDKSLADDWRLKGTGLESNVSILPVKSAGLELNSVLSGMGLERRPGIEIIPITAATTQSLPSSITITPIPSSSSSSSSSKGDRKSSSSKKYDDKSRSEKKRKRRKEESSSSSPMGPPDKMSCKQDASNRPLNVVSIKSSDGTTFPTSELLKKFSSKTSSSSSLGRPSPKHSPSHYSPKHSSGSTNSPKPGHYSTSSPKHSTSGSSGKPSMSALKSATNSSPKSEKSSSKSSSSRDKDRDRDRERSSKSGSSSSLISGSSTGGHSPKLKTSSGVKLKQIDLSAALLPNTDQFSFDEATEGHISVAPVSLGGTSDLARSMSLSVTGSNLNKVRKGSLSAVIDKLKSAQHTGDDSPVSSGNVPSEKLSVSSSSSSSSSGGSKTYPTVTLNSTKVPLGGNGSQGPSAQTNQNSEYMIKPSLDGMKITINKTRTKDLPPGSISSKGGTTVGAFSKIFLPTGSASGSSSPKRHTGLKPGVNSGPASKKFSSGSQFMSKSNSNSQPHGSQPGRSNFQKSSSSGSLSAATSSKGAHTSGKSLSSSALPNAGDSGKKDKVKNRNDASDVMKMLGWSPMDLKPFNSKFQIPKLSARTNDDSKKSDSGTKADSKTTVAPGTPTSTAITTTSTTAIAVGTPATTSSQQQPPIAVSPKSSISVTPVTSASSTDGSKPLLEIFPKDMQAKFPFSLSKLPVEATAVTQPNCAIVNNTFSKATNVYSDSQSPPKYPQDMPSRSTKSPLSQPINLPNNTVQKEAVKAVPSASPVLTTAISAPVQIISQPHTSPTSSTAAAKAAPLRTSPSVVETPAAITTPSSADSRPSTDEIVMRPPSVPPVTPVDMPKEASSSLTESDTEMVDTNSVQQPRSSASVAEAVSLTTSTALPNSTNASVVRKVNSSSTALVPQHKMGFPASPSVSVHIVKSPAPSPLMVLPSPHSNSPCITDDELMDEALVGISGK